MPLLSWKKGPDLLWPAPSLADQEQSSGNMAATKNKGMAKYGAQRQLFVKNRKTILATQEICAICGKPVDKTLKAGDPDAPEVDHIIPWDISHDCSLGNLQLTHARCNRAKSDKFPQKNVENRGKNVVLSNRILPQTFDWLKN